MMTPRLKEQYKKKIIIDLQKKFSMGNKLMVPRITKIVLNMGLGVDANNKKIVQKLFFWKLFFGKFFQIDLTPSHLNEFWIGQKFWKAVI